MRGLATVTALRFREAVAGRVLWLVPVHFLLALGLAAAAPGADAAGRLEAADSLSLGLAVLLAAAAAAALGAGPLPGDRRRARGLALLAGPVSPAARALGTVAGAGAGLLLLTVALLASALGAVELGTGRAPPRPRAFVRATAVTGGVADAARPDRRWTAAAAPPLDVSFPSADRAPGDLELAPLTRAGRGTGLPGRVRVRVRTGGGSTPGEPGAAVPQEPSAPWGRPLRAALPAGGTTVRVERIPGNYEIGLDPAACRRFDGTRPRILARGLHGAALGAGLLALLAATAALSTVTGSGVAAFAGATLLLLASARPSFEEAARTATHAGAVGRALEGVTADHGAPAGDSHDDHGPPGPAPPSFLVPVFRGLARILPDASRYDLSREIVAGEVPDGGDVGGAVAAGLGLAVAFSALAAMGAARRP